METSTSLTKRRLEAERARLEAQARKMALTDPEKAIAAGAALFSGRGINPTTAPLEHMCTVLIRDALCVAMVRMGELSADKAVAVAKACQELAAAIKARDDGLDALLVEAARAVQGNGPR